MTATTATRPPSRSTRSERTIDMRLPARLEAGRMARAELEPLRELMPAGDAFDDLLLVATELVSNAVVHAGLAPDASIRLEVRRRPGATAIRVEDDGCGFRAGAPRSDDGTGGRGLQIVARLARRWGIRCACGTAVWCELEDPPG